MEACSGESADFGRVGWFTMTDAEAMAQADEGDVQLGYRHGYTVWIHEAFVGNSLVVEHEMLHVLAGSGHPYRPFVDPCRVWPVTWARVDSVAGVLP